jgi:hypothetical protein
LDEIRGRDGIRTFIGEELVENHAADLSGDV